MRAKIPGVAGRASLAIGAVGAGVAVSSHVVALERGQVQKFVIMATSALVPSALNVPAGSMFQVQPGAFSNVLR